LATCWSGKEVHSFSLHGGKNDCTHPLSQGCHLSKRRWVRDISGALTDTAAVLCDYLLLQDMLEGIQLTSAVSDRFV
jgi:hypothetical protein